MGGKEEGRGEGRKRSGVREGGKEQRGSRKEEEEDKADFPYIIPKYSLTPQTNQRRPGGDSGSWLF